jgi:hypothetical protein
VTSGGERAGTLVGTGAGTMSSIGWEDGTQPEDREIDEDVRYSRRLMLESSSADYRVLISS